MDTSSADKGRVALPFWVARALQFAAHVHMFNSVVQLRPALSTVHSLVGTSDR